MIPEDIDASKEDLILKVASEVFMEKGFHGARIHDIAQRANLNQSLLHYYFRNKENIYAKTVQRLFVQFFSSLSLKFSENADVRTMLRLLINGLIDLISENPRLPTFIIQQISSGEPLAAQALVKAMKTVNWAFYRRLGEALEAGIAQGDLRRMPPVHLLITVIGACVYPFAARPLLAEVLSQIGPEVDLYAPEFLEARKQIVFEIVFHGIQLKESSECAD